MMNQINKTMELEDINHLHQTKSRNSSHRFNKPEARHEHRFFERYIKPATGNG